MFRLAASRKVRTYKSEERASRKRKENCDDESFNDDEEKAQEVKIIIVVFDAGETKEDEEFLSEISFGARANERISRERFTRFCWAMRKQEKSLEMTEEREVF